MRKYISIAILVTTLILVPGAVKSQDSAEFPLFQGIWHTELGTLAMWQVDDAVYGIYDAYGEVGGHINENGRLEFHWQYKPDDYGTGWFELNETGDRINGMWYSVLDADKHDQWEGTWIDVNTYELGDRAATNHKPGETAPASTETVDSETAAEVSDVITESENESVIEPPQDMTDAGIHWTGEWDTTQGAMSILVEDNAVRAIFGENYFMQGTIDGPILNAEWWTRQIDIETGEETEIRGEAIFWLAEDGMTFRGSYNVSDEPDVWLGWSGEKVSDGPIDLGDGAEWE